MKSINWIVIISMLVVASNLNANSLVFQFQHKKNKTGTIHAVLTNSQSGYQAQMSQDSEAALRGAVKRFKIPISGKSTTLEIPDLPPGEYALSSYIDTNDNGKIDIGVFGPSEPYAFSNNARGSFSAPSFEQSKIVLKEGTITQNIRFN